MKIAAIIVRTLMGLLFIFSAVVVLFKLFPEPELAGRAKIFMDGINASVYLMTLIKLTELFCGLAFVTGRFVPLAAVVIAPVTINILLFDIFVDQSGLPIGIALVLGNIFLGFVNRQKYKPMLSAK